MEKIYLLKTNENNPSYKIGITRRDVKSRIKELNTGNDKEIILVDYYESKWASKIESSLHYYFKNYKIKGEWFSLEEKNIDTFKYLCDSIHKNLEMMNNNVSII